MSTLMAVMLAASLSSCSTVEGMQAQAVEDELAYAAFTRIIDAINAVDADALEAEFSATAVAEDDNLESEIGRLFELLPDGVWSWRGGAGASGSHIRDGSISVYVHAGFDIVLDSAAPIRLSFLFYVFNEIDPENVGVYALSVTTAEDDIRWEGPGLFVTDSAPIVGGRP